MAHVSHKLSSSFEGALAGGGDPATSPLYVFGPFLKLIVLAGVAQVTFGASIWLVVLTVVAVSAMYRRVMLWVTDGSGGSGLCEEELGAWAVKVNASITFIEYTLTFLVSIAALVTFVADRFPAMQGAVLGVPYRTVLAVGLSIATGALVNRGPKMAARAFGPATAAILLLLWVMIFATIWQRGLELPRLDWRAFTPRYLELTVGGYARILALMTGIEIFANLVSAYRGTAAERSRMAFRSLVIIMGTTALTMLVVGPAILELSNPNDEQVSVFTQAMDKLLPAPLPYVGTLIGVAVLLSAAAASAQGLQNLVLGLRYRHYVPAALGRRNRYDVADRPVWLEVGIACACFVAFGTLEETYLTPYAAGVFVLLSLTGWAAVKRLLRETRRERKGAMVAALGTTVLASLLTTVATGIIFWERFFEGAYSYLVLVPALGLLLTWFRRRLGAPTPVEERLGLMLQGKGFMRPFALEPYNAREFKRVVVPLDGSMVAEQALPTAALLARTAGTPLVVAGGTQEGGEAGQERVLGYLDAARAELGADVKTAAWVGDVEGTAEMTRTVGRDGDVLVISRDGSEAKDAARVLGTSEVEGAVFLSPSDAWSSRRTRFSRLVVALDGSQPSEGVLPLASWLADRFGGELILVSAAEGSESDEYEKTLKSYLAKVEQAMRSNGLNVRSVTVGGRGPAHALIETAKEVGADLIALASHGRGGVERAGFVKLGSVAAQVLEKTPCPVLVVPIRGAPARSETPETAPQAQSAA